MINEIQLKFVSDASERNLNFSPGHVTIFLGPNNGGKSLLLREVEKWCANGPLSDGKILSDLKIAFPSPDQIIEEVKKFSLPPEPGETIESTRIKYGKLDAATNQRTTHSATIEHLKQWAKGSDQRGFTQYVVLYILRLDALTRLHLVGQQETNDLQRPSNNILNELFRDDEKRGHLRRIVKEAFGRIFVIDPTAIKQLRIRLADREPQPSEEKSLGKPAIDFYAAQPLIEEFSDGVRAFTGLLMAIIASSAKILLLDEPEAFLHPSLVSRLGTEISNIMSNREGNLFVATHSQKFLMGCIESGKNVNIIRLTYDENKRSTARMLSNEKVRVLMQNPLLRSVGVLEALFYNYVIVTEADADRAFYQEINQRLMAFKKEWGIQDCLFLNVHGKQEMWDVVKPLRELGIPVAAIADIDLIKNGGAEWKKVLEASFIPDASHTAFQDHRKSILDKFEATGKNMKREGGVQLLANGDRQAALDLFGQLQDYGIFIVPGGEIEGWLSGLEVSRDKGTWLRTIFEKLGSDPGDSRYVKPTDGDVWEFLSKVKKWLTDSGRKGVPS